jgi:hypothetical protein
MCAYCACVVGRHRHFVHGKSEALPYGKSRTLKKKWTDVYNYNILLLRHAVYVKISIGITLGLIYFVWIFKNGKSKAILCR